MLQTNLNHILLSLFIMLNLSCSKTSNINNSNTDFSSSKQELIREAFQHEIDKTKDPELDKVPTDRLSKAMEYYSRQRGIKGKTNTPFSSVQWQERGPNNVGGRTRAVLFLSATKVLAAGISGGLWIADDITSANPGWEPIGDFLSNSINISTLAQHPDSLGVLYAGTGEAFGSAHRGSGIYKSIDTGQSWNLISSTSASNSDDFTYVAKILVSKKGHVYAATKSIYCNLGGLMRSTNNGASWSRVVGTYTGGGCQNAFDFNGADVEENHTGDLFYASGVSNGHIFRSDSGTNVGDLGNWTDITPSGTWGRIEIGVSQKAGSEVIYAACEGNSSNDVTGIYYSTNNGANWTSRTVPTICDQGGNSPYTRSQAWYDQVVQIDPSNDSILYIGGIDLLKSTDAGASFNQITTWSAYWPVSYGCMCCSGSTPDVVHADQHGLFFNPYASNAALSANDGGVYYSTDMNASEPAWSQRNSGFNVTQYYAIATHPTDNHYLLGGTQDNGSHKLTIDGVGAGTSASGGDGGFCHIHQGNADYQLTSYVYNNHYYSQNGGSSFPSLSSSNANTGRFINPSDLDDANGILFSAGNSNVLETRSGVGTSTITSATHNLSFNSRELTALKVSPNNTTTLYVGDDLGNVYKISNRSGTPSVAATWAVSGSGYVSSIDVWESASGDDDSILVTLSSYGVNSVYYTANGTNGTPTWTDIDDNSTLQDMPVRWGVFSKQGADKIFIATDLGVLATDNINGNSTTWTMVNNDLLPNVRVDMLEYDADDNLVVATHGRGIWETKEPCNSSTAVLPSASGTYTSTKAVQEGNNTCFCDSADRLLLVLDTIGTGAVIPANGVSLEIGSSTTSSWNTSGGIFTNPDGASIINRKWNVNPTTQPTSDVTIKYFFRDEEYDSIVTSLSNLSSPTSISNPEELQFYKLTSAGVFADPHASGATGNIILHTGTPSTTTWEYNAYNNHHSATFKVSSFSGGGGGGGGGGSPLPVVLVKFDVIASDFHSAILSWQTAQEIDNKGFHIERSFDGNHFSSIAFIGGHGNSSSSKKYSFKDDQIPQATQKVFYRLVQEDFDGTQTTSNLKSVAFGSLETIGIYPNPVQDFAKIKSEEQIRLLQVFTLNGIPAAFNYTNNQLDVTNMPNGVYLVVIGTEEGKTVRKIVVEH